MNFDPSSLTPDEFESRITALVLGELSSDEAEAVRHAISVDPELAQLHARIQASLGFVTAAVGDSKESAVPVSPKLSAVRREALLGQLKQAPVKEFTAASGTRSGWMIPMGIAASVLAMLGAWELMPESGMRMAGARGVDPSPLASSSRYAMAPVPNSEPEGLLEQKQRPGLRWFEEKSVEAHDLALRRGGAVSQQLPAVAPTSASASAPVSAPVNAPAPPPAAALSDPASAAMANSVPVDKAGAAASNGRGETEARLRVARAPAGAGVPPGRAFGEPPQDSSTIEGLAQRVDNLPRQAVDDFFAEVHDGRQGSSLSFSRMDGDAKSGAARDAANEFSYRGHVSGAENHWNFQLGFGTQPPAEPMAGGTVAAGGGGQFGGGDGYGAGFGGSATPAEDRFSKSRFGRSANGSVTFDANRGLGAKPEGAAPAKNGDPAVVSEAAASDIEPTTGQRDPASYARFKANDSRPLAESKSEVDESRKDVKLGIALSAVDSESPAPATSAGSAVKGERLLKRIANPDANAKGVDRLQELEVKESLERGGDAVASKAKKSTPTVVEFRQVELHEDASKLSDANALQGRSGVSGVLSGKAPDKMYVPRPTVAPTPQPEVRAEENGFSTFSLNVTDVSFKLAAASLEKGTMPDPASIRVEEFVNALHYRDPEPAAGAPVSFAFDRAGYPFAHHREVLRFSVRTAAQGREAAKPLNLVLLVDNSGSMERADRVQILREAVDVLARQLQPQDRISVVTFARTPRLLADAVPGNQAAELPGRIAALTPEGGTDLGQAMNLAYDTASRHFQPGGVNRVVLLTDGAANLGDVEPTSLQRSVESWRQRGVALDCFGIGWEGLDDDMLETLARHGDGRYGFLNNVQDVEAGFASQLAGALRVAAADVKVQVEFNPQRVEVWRQVGYARHQLTKEQFRDNTVDAAELGAAESGNALYVVETKPAGSGPIATVRVRFRDPASGAYREHAWPVPYTGAATPLDRAPARLRLAATAGAFSEWLAGNPYAAEVTPDRLLGLLQGVPVQFQPDPVPERLEWMIRQAKAISGK